MARELSASMETILVILDALEATLEERVANGSLTTESELQLKTDTLKDICEIGVKYDAQKPSFPETFRSARPN